MVDSSTGDFYQTKTRILHQLRQQARLQITNTPMYCRNHGK